MNTQSYCPVKRETPIGIVAFDFTNRRINVDGRRQYKSIDTAMKRIDHDCHRRSTYPHRDALPDIRYELIQDGVCILPEPISINRDWKPSHNR